MLLTVPASDETLHCPGAPPETRPARAFPMSSVPKPIAQQPSKGSCTPCRDYSPSIVGCASKCMEGLPESTDVQTQLRRSFQKVKPWICETSGCRSLKSWHALAASTLFCCHAAKHEQLARGLLHCLICEAIACSCEQPRFFEINGETCWQHERAEFQPYSSLLTC